MSNISFNIQSRLCPLKCYTFFGKDLFCENPQKNMDFSLNWVTFCKLFQQKQN